MRGNPSYSGMLLEGILYVVGALNTIKILFENEEEVIKRS